MAEKIKFYPIDITYKVKDNKPIIYIFGRNVDGKEICVIDKKFRPYFYVELNDLDNSEEFISKIKKLKFNDRDIEAFVENAEKVNKKLIGKEKIFVKIIVNIPEAVNIIKNEIKDSDFIKSCYEFDIPFTRRYMIDKEIIPLTTTEVKGEIVQERFKVQTISISEINKVNDEAFVEPKIIAFDIETYNPDNNIDMDKNPILMISFYGKNFSKVITWKKFNTDKDYIEFVDGEAELIERFRDIIDHQRPDIISGYFSDGFDLPYIISRAKHYKIDLDLGLDFSKINYRKGKNIINITGILHLDVLRFIKKNFGKSLKTDKYTLDSVSYELLGNRKEDIEIKDLTFEWDKSNPNLEKFCSYNLQDSVLVYELCLKVWPNIIEFVKLLSLTPLEVTQMSFSQLVENYIIKQAKQHNEIILNKPTYHEENERRDKRFEGAFVYEPTPGLYNDIVVFDFRSLYPTIITSHNIGISTLVKSQSKTEEKMLIVPDKDYGFLKDKKGFLPLILEDLINRRMRVKEILKQTKEKDSLLQARSQSLKLLANSFYGYLGFSSARWYCLECATAVTAFGRYYINQVIDSARKEGFSVIYGDTDSVFMTLEGKNLDNAKQFVDDVNSKLPGMMELEFEGHYPQGIFVSTKSNSGGAKKRYALVDEYKELIIKGFEVVRRNWSPIGKEVQQNVLNIILKESDTKKALKYVRTIIDKVRNKEIDNSKMIIETQITKKIEEYSAVGPHVAIAKRMASKGVNINPGMMIPYIVIPGKGPLKDRVKIPTEAKDGEYDPEYYIENQILPTIEKIFEVLGYDKEELLKDSSQSGLDSFF